MINLFPKKKDVILLYDSIKELPAERDHEFHKMIAYDMGVGSTMEDFIAHTSKLFEYLMKEKNDEAIQEAKNMHNNYFNAINKINTTSLSFATLIKSVNDEPYLGTELQEHKDIILRLNKLGLKTSDYEPVLMEVKKKFLKNFNPIFLIDTEMKA